MDERNPMAEAEAQLYRRIQELRARARGEGAPGRADSEAGDPPPPPPVPDLRTLLSRAERHVEDLRSTASELERSLPPRIEQAVERALTEHGSARRVGELRDLMTGLAGQVEQLNRDLLAERLGRVEDLELVVELISSGVAALREDMSSLAADVSRAGSGVEAVIDRLDQPMQVTLERPRGGGVRDLFRPTESEPAHEVSPTNPSVAG